MKWLTALMLEQWAEKLNAKADFPEVILDLVRASAGNSSSYRFPHGDRGQVRGFDGVLECEDGNSFVPAGRSIWEFGLDKDYQSKADGEYKKRTDELALKQEDRKKMTFVFVTPRTWNKAKLKLHDWVNKKKRLNEWGDVKYIDGVQIEHWLDEHPAVAARYAKEFGFAPQSGASSADEFWDEFSLKFAPPLVEEVLLAGRAAQTDSLLRKLMEEGSKVAYAADTPDEVIAFVIAAVRKAPPEIRRYLNSRMVIVDSEEAARFLKTKKGLIYLPRGQARKLTSMLESAGTTIINAGADERRAQHHVALARPTK